MNSQEVKEQILKENPDATLHKWQLGEEPLVAIHQSQIPKFPVIGVNLDFADGDSVFSIDRNLSPTKDNFSSEIIPFIDKILSLRQEAKLTTGVVGPAICYFIENYQQLQAISHYLNADHGSTQESQAMENIKLLDIKIAVAPMSRQQLHKAIINTINGHQGFA